jgi:branched-chain amino acid transport system permease protein
MKSRLLPFFLLAMLALIPALYQATYFLHIFILIFFYIALSVAWNILSLSGKVSLGHAAFFGLGAYTSTILFVKHGVIPWIGVFAALGVALFGAVVLMIPLLRLRGPMFSLASIAFGEVLIRIAVVWRDMTAGSEGMTIPFHPGWLNMVFKNNVPYYYIFLILAAVSVYLFHRIYHSALGHHLRAVAADEEAAQALGVNTSRAQIIALLWSAGFTGVLGVFYAQFVYIIDPDFAFSPMLFSVQPALNGIIGGMGTIWGPVLGSVLMTPLGEYLRSYLGHLQQGLSFFIYGMVLIAVVMIMPGGIVSVLAPFFKRKAPGAKIASERKAGP